MKRDFRWYEVLSRMMLDIVGEHAEAVEYYSVDQFFFRPAPLTRRADLGHAAATVCDRIRDRAGLPVMVAIARTRTLAKLFSDTAKPPRSRPPRARVPPSWENLRPTEERGWGLT